MFDQNKLSTILSEHLRQNKIPGKIFNKTFNFRVC